MSDKFPDLTARQLAAFKAIESADLDRQKMRMAWLVLITTLSLIVAVTILIFVLIIKERQWGAATAIGLMNSVFGACLLRIIYSMWPTKKS